MTDPEREPHPMGDPERFSALKRVILGDFEAIVRRAERLQSDLAVPAIPDTRPDCQQLVTEAVELYQAAHAELAARHGAIDEAIFVDLDRTLMDLKMRIEQALGRSIEELSA